jgi:Tfp pilus assembly protein PilF
LALQKHELGQYSEAATLFLRAAAHAPALRALAARSIMEDGDLTAAHRQAVLAVQEAGQAPVTHFMLGLIAERMGELDESMREYSTVLSMNPNDPATHNNLGGVYYMREDFDTARAETETALRLGTNADGIAIALTNLAEFDWLQGDFESAEKKLDQALETAPEEAPSYFALATLYDVLHRDDAAMAMEKNAIALDAHHTTWRATSWVWPELQQHSEALAAEARGDVKEAVTHWTALRDIEKGGALHWSALEGRAATHLKTLGQIERPTAIALEPRVENVAFAPESVEVPVVAPATMIAQ